jgi:GT2 family glycosyltransferase
LADLQKAVRAAAQRPRTLTIGELPAEPTISVVVPLYRNLEFLQTQIAAFANDPAFAAGTEIIYVLDSPEQTAEVEQYLRGLNLLYRLPFTLVVMAENAGYAAACNAGAAVARGAFLAMVNSDVIPSAPGWLDVLTRRMAENSSIAACGPKLLFEDGSIQHAGLYFAVNHFGRCLNHHFYKGMPRDYAPATVERLVPAVTGACLVVRTDAFNEAGGFSTDYVIGDYEDSDFCLKLRALGQQIAYVPDAELYHLERQSIRHHEDYMRGCADRYNAWLHAGRWAETIRALDAPAADEPPMRSAA